MDWLWKPIDAYCERTDASLWSEPLNAISNVSFFVAAVLLARLALRERGSDRSLGLFFATLVGLIGIGSSIFHTFANGLGWLLDVAFIYAFMLIFLSLFLLRVLRRSAIETLGWVCVFVAAILTGVGMGGGPTCGYAITLFGMLILALAALHKRLPLWAPLLWACGLLALSLAARTFDLRWCEWNPRGTHFLWHLLNGVVLYLTATTLISDPRQRAQNGICSDV